MIVAYILEHILGLSIALAYVVCTKLQHDKALLISRRCLEVYHDCAAFLTFSIQIAAIVVLLQVDFAISTENMGDATVRITQAVSALTLLPLAYAIVLLHYSVDPEELNQSSTTTNSSRRSKEQSIRFVLFALCWVLSLYPFYRK